MYILGFAGGFDPIYGTVNHRTDHRFNMHKDELHDSSAVLIKDSVVVAAIEEERLTRIKHTNARAMQSIRFCLAQQNISINDLDYIAYPCTEARADRMLAMTSLKHPDIQPFWNARSFFCHLLNKEFDTSIDPAKLRFVEHHVSHAESAYRVSGFQDSLVVTLDGQGEGLAGTVFDARDGKLKRISNTPRNHSLGLMYEAVISFLGYKQHDEYKVMGLAPYGDPNRYRSLMQKLYRLRNDGLFNKVLSRLRPDQSYQLALGKVSVLKEVGEPRRKGQPFEQKHKDLAAALQEMHETIVLHHLEYYQKRTGHNTLCLAGGVAHNCSANGRILYSEMFDDIFVQPASHDAGCALGAALDVHRTVQPDKSIEPMKHVYLGTDVPGHTEITEQLESWSDFLEFEKLDDVSKIAAEKLSQGDVIGWVQGRSEFGPRALGNRCILADPRPEANKTRINAMVKKRESYRPFAPSVLAEHAHEYFNVKEGSQFPFMIMITTVKQDKRELLGATTHIDGTARIHTVNKEYNPRYWQLIKNFQKLTDVPVVLNTSFNNNVEPIVDSVEDAIVAFLTTDLDHLFVGDFQINKKPVARDGVLSLQAQLPAHIKLTQSNMHIDEGKRIVRHALSVANTLDDEFPISVQTYSALSDEHTHAPIRHRLDNNTNAMEITNEIWDLWEKRLIRLSPCQRTN